MQVRNRYVHTPSRVIGEIKIVAKGSVVCNKSLVGGGGDLKEAKYLI